MAAEAQQKLWDGLVEQSSDVAATPFDYIVIGSGAGGGPLAARLALSGRRVLVIEAGLDEGGLDPVTNKDTQPREVYDIPAYNGAATEDAATSWDFSVRHYDCDKRQRADPKYDPAKDPSTTGGRGKGGIFYPRAAAVGGCTSHYAMIIIRPNDADWDDIAEFTRDESWRSDTMQGYFPKIERCLYYNVYRGFFGRLLGGVLKFVQFIATSINPRRQLDPNGHGFNGWQPTSFIDPIVVAGIARRDPTLLGLLFNVIWTALASKAQGSRVWRAVTGFQFIQFLDPNVRADGEKDLARLSLLSIGTDGMQRCGLREWLLAVAEKHPERLVILRGAHATRLIFEKDKADPAPRAIGVEVAHGPYLYKASKRHAEASKGPAGQYFARREVIVSGGSFNSPQLLMLSGIGDAKDLNELEISGPRDRSGVVVAPVVDLPGVGANLQDRYEVSVVSELKKDFATLKDASFEPGDADDPLRKQWVADKTGLYGTNGGALAMMMSSSVNTIREDPDIFLFGAPAAFRGYYWNWSKELLHRTQGAGVQQRNLWSWVILKAYTNNNSGTVKLLTNDPFDVPDINFRSFAESPDKTAQVDVDALCDIVQRVREINGAISGMKEEIQPGEKIVNQSLDLRDWVQREAWGHHACGTCRMGADRWQADVTALRDKTAVLDSSFRVQGVQGLRVVDASVFPKIPGYFIVTPVFMISEKAADVILNDSPAYPSEVEQLEAAAIYKRRRVVDPKRKTGAPVSTTLPEDCIGLALSGGGVRSATYSLGILQSLAATKMLRNIDVLSTVSGGGYVGGFLGRLYTRILPQTADKAERVEAVLENSSSPEIWWLRQHANYLAGAGRSDLETNLAVITRNLAAGLFCIAVFLVGLLGGLRAIFDYAVPAGSDDWRIAGTLVSPYWRISAALLFLAVLPLASGYWLTPNTRSRYPYSGFGLLAWAVVLGCAIAALGIPGMSEWALFAMGVLLLAWLWQEIMRWGASVGIEKPQRQGSPKAVGELDYAFATLYRNRITRTLGVFLLLFAATIPFVIIDTLARSASQGSVGPVMGGTLLVAAPFLPFLSNIAVALSRGHAGGKAESLGVWTTIPLIGVVAFSLSAFGLFAVDVVAHAAFERSWQGGIYVVVAALVFSAAFGGAQKFVNLSSLQEQLTQKVTRTFLGAANDRRVHPVGTTSPVPIQVSDEFDDGSLRNYHPEESGGPLHLINVCVNQTVDQISGRQLRQNKGVPMCVGPAGMSVGLQYHATWGPSATEPPESRINVWAVPVAPDPHMFHALARSDRDYATVEQLSLGHWMAISAASLSTGVGRRSSLPVSLLFGLLNVRLGYWWDSGINPGDRPGLYPPSLWRRIVSLPFTIFAVQAMFLNEWRGRFEGPSAKRWYLSDGGHFDNTGLYELVRRRLPFIIAVGAEQDEKYEFDDLAIFTRQARLDFGAELVWLDPVAGAGAAPWAALDAAAAAILPALEIPELIKGLVKHPAAIGGLDQIKRDGPTCAALARIVSADQQDKASWLLLIKPNLAPKVAADVRNYAAMHPSFPNQSTVDQFFDDDQWESYRSLGEAAGRAIF